MGDAKVLGQIEPTVGFGFLMVEIQTGQMFASLALDAGDNLDKAEQNTENARKAYDSILHFRDRVQMDELQVQKLEAGLEHLRANLQELGEDLQDYRPILPK